MSKEPMLVPVLVEHYSTDDTTPKVGIEGTGSPMDMLHLVQGPDLIIIPVEDWEQYASEVMGVIMSHRAAAAPVEPGGE